MCAAMRITRPDSLKYYRSGAFPSSWILSAIFPFSDKVDYASFALVVDFRDINRLPERIAEFHKNISPERFEQMQKNARDAYVNHFRIAALMCHIVEKLRA